MTAGSNPAQYINILHFQPLFSNFKGLPRPSAKLSDRQSLHTLNVGVRLPLELVKTHEVLQVHYIILVQKWSILGYNFGTFWSFFEPNGSKITFGIARVAKQVSAATLRPKIPNFVPEFPRGGQSLCQPGILKEDPCCFSPFAMMISIWAARILALSAQCNS